MDLMVSRLQRTGKIELNIEIDLKIEFMERWRSDFDRQWGNSTSCAVGVMTSGAEPLKGGENPEQEVGDSCEYVLHSKAGGFSSEM